MPPPGRFSFARAVREWCFVQLPLVELGAIRKVVATARGLEDFGHTFAPGAWKTLDREGLLEPVAYARHGMWHYNQPECLEDGDLTIREEVGHRPWGELREDAESVHGEQANVQILYHHWQLLWLRELQRELTPGVPWGNLSDGLDTSSISVRGSPRPLMLPSWISCESELRSGVQSSSCSSVCRTSSTRSRRGGPRESNWTGSVIVGLTDDAIEWSVNQLDTLDYAALANDCDATPAELQATYEKLVRVGRDRPRRRPDRPDGSDPPAAS